MRDCSSCSSPAAPPGATTEYSSSRHPSQWRTLEATGNFDLDDLARQAAQIPSRGLLSGSSKVRLAMCLRIQMFTTLLQLFR